MWVRDHSPGGGRVAELADAGDLKSPPRSRVRVRVPARLYLINIALFRGGGFLKGFRRGDGRETSREAQNFRDRLGGLCFSPAGFQRVFHLRSNRIETNPGIASHPGW